jgi:hypothetical protein
MKEIYEIVFLSSRSPIELVREKSGLFGVIKIVDGKEHPLYANRELEPVQKYYNKKIGAR